MSTYKSVAYTIKEVELWLRLSTFLHEPFKFALLRILHNAKNDPNYDGLPEDPHLLYQELRSEHFNLIQHLKKKKILQQDQINLIFPPNDNKTDSTKFDITLICILIRKCLIATTNKWLGQLSTRPRHKHCRQCYPSKKMEKLRPPHQAQRDRSKNIQHQMDRGYLNRRQSWISVQHEWAETDFTGPKA